MSALERLETGYYNSQPVSVGNPGGFGAGGHVVNFPAALADIAEVGAQLVDLREAVDALVPIRDETWAAVAAFTVKPDLRRVFLLDTLIGELIDSGVWAGRDLFYLTAAHHEQAARVNLKQPGLGDLTAINSPTFTVDRGYQGDGVTAWLDTGKTLASLGNYTQNDAGMFVWARANVAETARDIGTTASFNASLASNLSGNISTRANDGTTLSTSVTTSAGLSAWSRADSGGYAVYRDGALAASHTQASTGVPGGNVCLGRANTTYSTKPIAAGGVGAALSAPQQASLYGALRRFLVGVGAV